MNGAPTVAPRGGRRRLAAAVAIGAALLPAARAADDPAPAPAVVQPAGPLPLLDAEPAPAARRRPAASTTLPDWRVLGAIGAAFVVLLAARGRLTRRAVPLPPDVFEVLGAATLGGQHAVRIVRFGPKTLLVGVSASGMTTLAELADPQATARIAAACGGQRLPARPTATRVAAVPTATPGSSISAGEAA